MGRGRGGGRHDLAPAVSKLVVFVTQKWLLVVPKELISCFHLGKTCFSQQRGRNHLNFQGLMPLALARPEGQETRRPSGGGEWLLFGFVTHQRELERSPGGQVLLAGRCWALLGTFPSSSGVITSPEAVPEHPMAAGNETNTALRGTSALGGTGIKAP